MGVVAGLSSLVYAYWRRKTRKGVTWNKEDSESSSQKKIPVSFGRNQKNNYIFTNWVWSVSLTPVLNLAPRSDYLISE